MIVSIDAPEFVKQWLMNYQKVRDYTNEQNVFVIHHKHHLSNLVSLFFRRPKGNEMVKDFPNGLKVKPSAEMVRDMKIYVSPKQNIALVNTVKQAMFENFVVDVQAKLLLKMKDRDAIYGWLEENSIDCDKRTFQMFEKRFYRSQPLSHRSEKINYTRVLSENVRKRPNYAR